jgi:valyl-tRNA synthetase
VANVRFGGIMDPESDDFKYYYPTNDLDGSRYFIFLWLEIIAGYEYTDKKNFNVYLTGLVRDKQRRKMSNL